MQIVSLGVQISYKPWVSPREHEMSLSFSGENIITLTSAEAAQSVVKVKITKIITEKKNCRGAGERGTRTETNL